MNLERRAGHKDLKEKDHVCVCDPELGKSAYQRRAGKMSRGLFLGSGSLFLCLPVLVSAHQQADSKAA